jgi:hypothetical protein
MTPEEVAVLNAEIHGIKNGIPLTLSSLTLNLSLVSGAYFITRASVDLNRYSGIPGVQFSVAATGTPAKTALFSGVITAGTGEMLGGEKISTWVNHPDLYPYETFNTSGCDITQAINSVGTGAASAQVSAVADVLYKFTSTVAVVSGGAPLWGFNSSIVRDGQTETPLLFSSGDQYVTNKNNAGYIVVQRGSATEFSAVGNTLKPVLTPDTTGILAAALTNGGIDANAVTKVVTVSRP